MDGILAKRISLSGNKPESSPPEELDFSSGSLDDLIRECNERIDRLLQTIDSVEREVDGVDLEIQRLQKKKEEIYQRVSEFEQEKILWERKLRKCRRMKSSV